MNGIPRSRLRVAILAAGLSTRLGHPKALAHVRGVSLLRRTLLLSRGLSDCGVLVVVPPHCARYRFQARGLGASFVSNPQRAAGLSASVRLAVTRSRCYSAVLLLPVDLVALKRRELVRLVDRWRAAPRRMIARRIGRQGGVPLILPRRLFALTRQISGDVGLRRLMRSVPSDRGALHDIVLQDMPSASLDVDTPHDLKFARARFNSASS